MKVILPVAGKGTRLLPQTHTKPKCLVRVAGQPILGHILDRIRSLPIEEIIVIIDSDKENEIRIRDFMQCSAPKPVKYVRQLELKGPAHAVFLAREYIDGDVFIIFNDTLFEADIAHIEETTADGVIWVREVEDPRRFGIVVTKGDRIIELVEKPEVPKSNLAQIGMFYVKDGQALMKSIEQVMREGRTVKGEFYLPDPFQKLIDNGHHFNAVRVNGWYDCGTIDALLDTNRALLAQRHKVVGHTEESVIIPPVYIEEGAHVSRSVIGPYVSISAGVVMQDSIVRDSIINEKSSVEDAHVKNSLIGENTVIKGTYKRLNVGDYSNIQYE